MFSLQLTVYFLITISIIMGQISSNPTCPKTNLKMTPNLRQKILDAMNTARKTVKNGQMQLYNGQYALPAAEMLNLVWSCSKEVELHHYLKSACDANPEPYGPVPDISWNHFGIDVEDYNAFIENGLSQSNGTFGMSSSLFMARSPIFTGTQRLDIYYANAETVGCAMYNCDIRNKAGNEWPGNFSTQIVCSVDPKVQFGEELYEVASSATNYIPPSQNVICQDSIFDIELREMVMKKINEIRSKIQDGSYQLENGEIALKASKLNNLAWSCDEEAAIGSALSSISCDDTLYNPATEFQKIARQTTLWIYPDDIKGFVNQLMNEFFVSNANFNFLSSSRIYSTEYPAAFALSDKSTTFACNAKSCYRNGGNDYHFVCRAKPSIQINELLLSRSFREVPFFFLFLSFLFFFFYQRKRILHSFFSFTLFFYCNFPNTKRKSIKPSFRC